MRRLGVQLERLEPQRLHKLLVGAADYLEEPLGVVAADEELDGVTVSALTTA